MIELRHISKTYVMGENAVHALQDISLTIDPGDCVAIMGASGSGKSTLLHILGFLDTPDSGEYLFFGKKVHDLSDDDLAALRNQTVGFIFQQFHLLRRMSAQENVALPCIYSSSTGEDINKKALTNLEAVGLKDRAAHWSSELSGGQQQRVAIARALIRDPMIIFADEPTGNLDTHSEKEIMQVLLSLNQQGKTVIIVTHEREVAEYAKRIITMRDGKILSDERRTPVGLDSPSHDISGVFSKRRSLWNKEEFFGHVKQAVTAIVSNKARSLLSILGILVGVAAVIAMMALGSGAQRSMENALKSLGSNLLSVRGGGRRMGGAMSGSGTVTRFSFADEEAMNALTPYVSRASGFVSGSVQAVYGNANDNVSLEGVGYDYGEMRAYVPEVGRWFTKEEIRRRDKVAIIGMTVLENLFGKGVNPIGRTIKLNRINFRVIGVFPAKGSAGPRDQDNAVLIPVTTAMYRALGKDYLDGVYVEISDASLMEEAKEELKNLIYKRHKIYQNDEDAFHIWDMSEIQNMLSATTKTMTMLLGCIAAISLIVGGIGIMNIMLVSVTERTREIGLRKAVGARKIDIMMQFLIESVVMTLSGGLLGVVLGAGAAYLLSLSAGWATHVSVFSVLLATVFSVAVGIGFGLWPAKKAAELKPVEALRYE
jgi:macrolide transport system ATP-binding/permease protein